MADRIKRIKACLNGRRDPAEHPAVPVTPVQLASEARAAVAAGAEAVHVHPRGSDGRQSLRAADVGAAVRAIRAACPGTPVGVTTGLWVTGDARSRQAQVAAWADLGDDELPDFASVNVSEEGWRLLAGTLDGAGIRVEGGVWSVQDAQAAADFDDGDGWLRILLELPGGQGEAGLFRLADEILDRLRGADVTAPVVLHGEDQSCWPLISHAGRLGLATRIGLEDVLTGPGGQPVGGNGELVTLALAQFEAARSPS
jgi:uncharacterized protein (DUF849 family)